MSLKKTIILKTNMNCNLRCKYCYEFNRNDNLYNNDMISEEKLNEIIERVAKIFPDSHVLWMLHGGESTINGLDYFKSFIKAIRHVRNNYKVNFQIALQTNGVLLNDEWIKFIEENTDLLSERTVSISIDGPKVINDTTRVNVCGSSSYDKIIDSIKKIEKSKLTYSTISVIGSHNVCHPEEMYNFFKNLQPNLCKFIPCYNFSNTGEKQCYGIYPSEYADFLCKIFDLWINDLIKCDRDGGNYFIIDPIITSIAKICDLPVTWCEYNKRKCDNFISLYPDGEMWLCDTYDHTEGMRDKAFIGNIYSLDDEGLKKSLEFPCSLCKYEAFYNDITETCESCNIKNYCCSGCLPLRYEMKNKSIKLFKDYCKAKHQFINHVKENISYALPKFKNNI